MMNICATVTSQDFVSSFGHVWCLTVDSDGIWLVCTRSALYAIFPEGPELIAGQHNTTRMGLKDGQGLEAKFNYPKGIALDQEGNIYLADSANNAVRKVTRSGTVTTLAGALGIAGYADGEGSAALFRNPTGVAVCRADGTILVIDSDNHCIRRISSIDGWTETVAGSVSGLPGFNDAHGRSALFCYPGACALDSCGNLIVTDWGNSCIRRVSLPFCRTASPWLVTTIAGCFWQSGFADGQNMNARFSQPAGVAVDNHGNIFVADRKNNRIRLVDNGSGRVSTLCGSAESGRSDGSGDIAHFNQPYALAIDKSGRLLVAEFKCLGRLRAVRMHLPWSMLRVLFVGLLKCRASAGGCWLALLPVEGDKSLTSPLLNHIIGHLCPACVFPIACT